MTIKDLKFKQFLAIIVLMTLAIALLYQLINYCYVYNTLSSYGAFGRGFLIILNGFAIIAPWMDLDD